MQLILSFYFLIPLLGFLLSLLFKNQEEKVISGIAIGTTGLHILTAFGLLLSWLIQGARPVSFHVVTLYRNAEFEFGLDLFYDQTTAVYAIVAALLVLIVSIFSKYYMHRESGFKRFYNHFLLFYAGVTVLVVSGNPETFFLGWEIVGITSFLLIAFYRERYLPVRNSLKVLSFYRLGDAALLGAIWFTHHLFHGFSLFGGGGDFGAVANAQLHHPVPMVLTGLLFVVAAAVKSAQAPFSGWLPRAMEGPTVSSAIFYGAISVHLGVFLLLRTYPVWAGIPAVKTAIIAVGVITAIVGSAIGRVQPTAKTQIAYSSLAQIGLMFAEVAMGWHILALVHFACNAFLRTYQLLASPSSMSYLTHEQFFNYKPGQRRAYRLLPRKFSNTVYMLSVKEWNLDYAWFRYIWTPLKKAGRSLHLLRRRVPLIAIGLLLATGVVHYFVYPLGGGMHQLVYVSRSYSFIALSLILVAWTERQSARRAWTFITLSQVFFMLSVIQQHSFDAYQILIYLSGTAGAFAGGLWCLSKVRSMENNIDLNGFHGHIYEHPKYGLFFLICSLTMVGFPISPTFLGFDILFSEIGPGHRLLLVVSSLTFIFLELSVLRIYARIFLGQHVKTYHEVAFRNS